MPSLDTIELSVDSIWTDRYKWSPVVRSATRSLSGQILIQQGERVDGRPITINCSWMSRLTLDTLWAYYNANPDGTFPVTIGGTAFTCTWNPDVVLPISSEALIERGEYDSTDWFDVMLYLIEV